MKSGSWFVAGVGFFVAIVFVALHQSHTPRTRVETTSGTARFENMNAEEDLKSQLRQKDEPLFESGLPLSSSVELADPVPGIEAELDDWFQGPLLLDSTTRTKR